MKRITLALMLLLGAAAMVPEAKASPSMDVGVDFFYSNLSPYGEWVSVGFGQAWRPYHVAHNWRPYMYGRWEWTDYGWYWASYEPYGWATYHYGRWIYDDYYGWIWQPDDVWGPAWVEWRYSDDYIGWAPLPPAARFSFSFGITYTERWAAPVHYWNFVPCRNFAAVHVDNYVQPVERSRRIFGSTRGTSAIEASGERVINRGIDPSFVERRGNVRIEHAEVVNVERERGERVVRESGRDRVEVYRPKVDNRMGDTRPTYQGRDNRNERNLNEGRSYNEMHGYRRETNPAAPMAPRENAAPDRSAKPSAPAESPRFDRRNDGNRRSVETPERWRQPMPERKSFPGAGRPQIQRGGNDARPQHESRPAPQRSGNGRGRGRG